MTDFVLPLQPNMTMNDEKECFHAAFGDIGKQLY